MNIAKTIVVLIVCLCCLDRSSQAQTTEFTYQGSLQNSSVPANGNFDFEFLLYDAVSGGNQIGATLTRTSVAVAAGMFAVKLDFGAQFPGASRFLEIRVRTAGGGAFTPLVPRQPVSSSPYAVKSLNADQLSGFTADGFIRNQTGVQLGTFNVFGNGIIGGNAGIGTSAPNYKLHVVDPSNTGIRVQTEIPGGTVASFGGNGAFYIDAPGVIGGRFAALGNGNVGIGTSSPAEKLSVNGKIQSTTGGFKFPDGSVQTAAANTTFTKVRDSSSPIEILGGGGGGGWSSVALMTVPGGVYQVTATIEFRNNANFFGQNNTRRVTCGRSGGGDEVYSSDLPGLSRLTSTFHWVSTVGAGTDNISVFCYHNGDFTNQFQAAATRITAVKIEGNVVIN